MVERYSEWAIIEKLLPAGWEEKARELGAFKRATQTPGPGDLLRLLLFNASNDGGTRDTVAQAKAAGLHSMSDVALLKRLETAGDWLRWIAAALAQGMRETRHEGEWSGLRPRVIDGTCVQSPGVTQPDWRIHYTLDLATLDCDWHELHEGNVPEGFELAPISAGDVILGDRNYLTHRGAKWVTEKGAYLLVRLRWSHPRMVDLEGKRTTVLPLARKLRPNEIGDWAVELKDPKTKEKIPGRLIAMRLPHPLGLKAAERRVRKQAKKNKTKNPDPRSIESCKYVLVFTTLPKSKLSAAKVLELYRYRWQVELAFKRLKQILGIGWVPNKRRDRAATWITAKLILALLLEKLHRNAMSVSPWGYELQEEAATAGEVGHST